MELRDAAIPRARQCVRRRTTQSFGSRHVLSERPRERATDTREKLMSIVAVPRVTVVAFAVVCATSLASEARAQSTQPRQRNAAQTAGTPSFLGRGARAHLGEPQQWPAQYPVHWKGCVWLKKGARVEVVDSGNDLSTEIIYKGKHWFADDPLF